MKKVAVKWLKSPRHKYRIPRAPGSRSLIDLDLAKRIRKEAPDFFISEELDALEKKKEKPPVVRTRPITRAKKD